MTLSIVTPGLWAAARHYTEIQTPAFLERRLGQATRQACAFQGGWETRVAECLGWQQPQGGKRRWLAWPVAMTPGMTDVVAYDLHNVAADELEQLLSACAEDFVQAEAHWRWVAPGLLEVEFTAEGAWQGDPPSVGLGHPMVVRDLKTPAMQRVQVLANAIQMQWFNHAVNTERQRQDQQPIAGLWFWSPGVPTETPRIQRLAGGGCVAQWLAEAVDIPWDADPLSSTADCLVLEAFVHPPTPERFAEGLHSLVEDVLRPRWPALWGKRAGRMLELHDPGAVRVSWQAWDRFKLWRGASRLGGS